MSSLSEIDALVLCGGLGTRLEGLMKGKPKVMAAFGSQPFLDIQLAYLKVNGFKRIILCTGHKAEGIEDYYRENSQGLIIDYSREEEPLGTGGAIKNAEPIIQSDSFYAMNGDCFCNVPLNSFFSFHESRGGVATIVASKVKEKKDFGSILIDGDDQILGFKEKQQKDVSPYLNAGQYLFTNKVLSMMPEGKFSLEYDIFPQLVGKGFYAFKLEEAFFDIGTPERLKKAQQILKKDIEKNDGYK